MHEVAGLARLLAGASAAAAFAGAGISTESGIPYFRSPGGVWPRHDPRDFTFSKYVRAAEVRARGRRTVAASAPPPLWAFALRPRRGGSAVPGCGGIVKSATVSFGQNLFPGELDAAEALIAAADLVLAVGSSLQVYPAAGLPASAAAAGAPLVICKDEPTPLDDLATLVIRGRAGTVLPTAAGAALGADTAA